MQREEGPMKDCFAHLFFVMYAGLQRILASFPGLPASSFWLLRVSKNRGGRPFIIWVISVATIYLGRQRGEGPLNDRACLRPFLTAPISVLELQMFVKKKCSHAVHSVWLWMPLPSLMQCDICNVIYCNGPNGLYVKVAPGWLGNEAIGLGQVCKSPLETAFVNHIMM